MNSQTHSLVVSYCTIQDRASGGKRRVDELLQALTPHVRLVQPAPSHPGVPCDTYLRDFGTRKFGFNWGIFNSYWPANRRVLRQAAAGSAAIVLTSIWLHKACQELGKPTLLDAQNVDGRAISERFGPKHPFTIWVKRVESRVVHHVDRICCCSEVDAAAFCDDYGIGSDRITIAPNGVSPAPAPSRDEAVSIRESYPNRYLLFFMGKLDYAPNIEALRYITGPLMSTLEQKAPGQFACLVTGGPAWPACPQHPNVHYQGLVPDVAPWMAAADACIAPVFSGSGTRLKILEYMAMAKPVIATAKAIEGISAAENREYLRADRDSFADIILHAAMQQNETEKIGEYGRSLVHSRYTWEQTQEIWRDVVESLWEPAHRKQSA